MPFLARSVAEHVYSAIGGGPRQKETDHRCTLSHKGGAAQDMTDKKSRPGTDEKIRIILQTFNPQTRRVVQKTQPGTGADIRVYGLCPKTPAIFLNIYLISNV